MGAAAPYDSDLLMIPIMMIGAFCIVKLILCHIEDLKNIMGSSDKSDKQKAKKVHRMNLLLRQRHKLHDCVDS